MELFVITLLIINTLLIGFLIIRKKSTSDKGFETFLHNQFQKEFMINREELSKNLQENRNELSRK